MDFSDERPDSRMSMKTLRRRESFGEGSGQEGRGRDLGGGGNGGI